MSESDLLDIEKMSQQEIDEILESFKKCSQTVRKHSHPRWPAMGDVTNKTIRSYPAYQAFSDLSNETKYFLFMCSYGASIRLDEFLASTVGEINVMKGNTDAKR
jgi:hypothetical protein